MLAKIETAKGSLENGIRILVELRAQSPRDVDVLDSLAKDYEASGRPEEVRSVHQELDVLGWDGVPELEESEPAPADDPSVDSSSWEDVAISTSLFELVLAKIAWKHLLFPLMRDGVTLKVVMAYPDDLVAVDDVRFLTGYDVEPVTAPEPAVRNALERHYGRLN